MLNGAWGKTPRITRSLLVARVGPTPQGVLSLDFGTRTAHVWARPDPRYGPWQKNQSISMPDDACNPADLMFDGGPSMHASCSRGASLCRQATTSTRLSTAVSLFDQAPAPLVRDLTSVPAARATMSWHGQAKQPIMLRGQSVSASVPDAQGPSLWSSVGAKGAVAAVCPQSM